MSDDSLGWILLLKAPRETPNPQLFTGFSGSMQTLDLHLDPDSTDEFCGLKKRVLFFFCLGCT